MRILVFSWEYPPKAVGGLAQHVYDITQSIVQKGHTVDLITIGGPDIPEEENIHGVYVHRVIPYQVSSPNFITWVMQLNIAMLEKCLSLNANEAKVWDVVHAHDWLVAYVSRAVKHALNIPLIATVHATEYGRNNGLHNELQRHISDIEWWLCYEAWQVIICSHYMQEELKNIFQLPTDKLAVIPNGVNDGILPNTKIETSRIDYAAIDEKIVYFVGRLVREKGVQILLEAVPKILHYHPKTKFVIGGKGPYLLELKRLSRRLKIEQQIYFTGYLNNDAKNALYQYADVAVFPSLYEPFGIVALEAMVNNTPVVVSDTGGLGEIVKHGVNGLKCYTGNANSLADNIVHLLLNPQDAAKMTRVAKREVRDKYNWSIIADQTLMVYQKVINNHPGDKFLYQAESGFGVIKREH